MAQRIILDTLPFKLTIDRLCYQLLENHQNFSESAIIGVQPRGVLLAERILSRLKEWEADADLPYGKLDITFYRDDFRTGDKPHTPSETTIDFSIEDKRIILIDDVLYTGRTIRSALDALLDFGRPKDVELLVLIDRKLHRHVPIQAKYVGKTVHSISNEKVRVQWKKTDGEDKIWIVPT